MSEGLAPFDNWHSKDPECDGGKGLAETHERALMFFPGGLMKSFSQIGAEIGELVAEKQKAYGDSFGKAGGILHILYPNGVTPEQYTDMLCVVRIVDKLFRIATAKDALGESPYSDICGYALLGAEKDRR